MRSLIGSGRPALCSRIAPQLPLSRRAIFLTVLAVNLLGDQLRARLDPRLCYTLRNDL